MISLIQHPDDLKNRDVSHCIVLTPHGEPCAETLAALSARNLDFAVANDELVALAQALLCDRLDETRAAWGLRPTGSMCLIIESPQTWMEIELLIDALSTYCDNALVLRLDSRGSSAGESPGHPFRQPPVSPSSIPAEEAPMADPPTSEEGDPDDRTGFISAEEIAMLLDRTLDEDHRE